jgi:hypothetical protein
MSEDAPEGQPALYVVYLGGHVAEGRMGEDHEVVLVVGRDLKEARRRARAKWRGIGKPHVDAVQRIERVDGHMITLLPGAEGDSASLDPTYHRAD